MLSRSPIDFLLLERDDVMADILGSELSNYGTVHRVDSVGDAVLLLAEARPLGIVVPNGQGLDVAAYAVTSGNTRKAMIAADSPPTREELNRAHEIGAVYLVKPLHMPVFRSWAMSVLGRRGERAVRDRVAIWRRRYGLSAEQANTLSTWASGRAQASLEAQRERVRAMNDALGLRGLLEQTGDATMSTAVARLHLEIAEQCMPDPDDEDDEDKKRSGVYARQPERQRVVQHAEGTEKAQGHRSHAARRGA